ncbi:MAG: bifunctional folylpolyglutamate synthase/dihydrofolate synthase [Candidatus Nanopelagicaceae bacterium]
MVTAEELEVLKVIEAALIKRWPENQIEPSLDRIAALVDALGSPQLSFPTIHIGGTNGKTSTARMVDALFTELEYRTGRFTSPHLESFLERISIKGEAISPAELIATYNDIALYLDLIDSRSEHPISYFEALTALAFAAFAEHPVDIGIIEVGMGGDWDATNVIQSAVSVLMPIGLDHTEYLGETIEEIAKTKAGIIKPESHVVLAAQEPEVARILLEKVLEKSAIPYREGIEFALIRRDIAVGGQLISVRGVHGEYNDIYLPLHGAHQAANAAVAIATVEAFVGVKLDEDLVTTAFANVSSPGRLEILHRDPTVIVDAAHNPHGAKALAETIRSEFDFESVFCVLGILGDKDVKGFLKALEPVVDRLVVTKSDSPRALPVADLFAQAVEIFGHDRVFKEDDLASAITYAMEQVTLINQVSDGVSAVVITGSVVTAGSARVILKKIGRAEEK